MRLGYRMNKRKRKLVSGPITRWTIQSNSMTRAYKKPSHLQLYRRSATRSHRKTTLPYRIRLKTFTISSTRDP